ncbi:hypothetical protein [Fusibacter ferrireducens]|uniref:Uncharacterized protein n=1 Tax=Fusibacter ferrireducens TaxID=2785058 RepID=A0ABR9ZR59_9FIRM|nr:hypothetical protein [Fusibacter ferrireducens]MBF4692134.1 hypothetical protein [Fusibacter ferrireducens]
MEREDITRTIIELTIDKVFVDVEIDAERRIRNLVDLGQNFSKGQFQRSFFEMVQKMLANDESPYYLHAKNTIAQVNHETLKTFGINLGYNGCTKGVRQIRENRATYHFNIPWSITFSLTDTHRISQYDIERVILEGEQLGVYVYLIFCTTERIKEVVYLLEKFPDCAFILFLKGTFIKSQAMGALHKYHNFMISTLFESKDCSQTTDYLTQNGFLHAVHSFYNDAHLEEIISGAWIKNALRTSSTFAFLIHETSCSHEVKKEVEKYVIGVREQQRYPIFLMEFTMDMNSIDRIISEESHSIGFNSEGQVYTAMGKLEGGKNNLLAGNLQEILEHNMPIHASGESTSLFESDSPVIIE